MGFIWSLIVGGVLGAVAGMILGKDVPGGIIGNIIVGFIGSWIALHYLVAGVQLSVVLLSYLH